MSRNGTRYNPVPGGTATGISQISPIPRKTVGSGALPNEKNGIKYHTVPLEPETNPSYVSLISREIAGSGPAQNEPALITSSWGIGWKIPALMTANYFLGMKNHPPGRCLELTPSSARDRCHSLPSFPLYRPETCRRGSPGRPSIVCRNRF
jgi:hypothetical protein